MSLADETDLLRKVMNPATGLEEFELNSVDRQMIYDVTLGATAFKGWRKPMKLRPYQLDLAWEIVDSVINERGRELTGMFARQSGKSETMGATLHFIAWLCSVFPSMKGGVQCGAFGPKQGQAALAASKFKDYLATGFIQTMCNVKELTNNSREVRLSNGFRLFIETASKNADIEGLTLHLAICEESQKIDDLRLLNSIFPMLTSTNGTRVLTGTPTIERIGYFYRTTSRGGPFMVKVPWRMAAKFSKNYKAYVEREIRKHGVQSDYIQTQYELNWITKTTHFANIEELTTMRSGQLILESDIPVVAAIDPAKIGDSSVLTIIGLTPPIPHVFMWNEWSGDDYVDQAKDLNNILSCFSNVEVVGVDTLQGGGEALSEMIDRKYLVQRLPMASKLKSDAMTKLREAIVHQRFTYPDIDQVERFRFEEQMTEAQAKYVGNVFKVQAPTGRHKHDDYVDSMALAFWLVPESMWQEKQPPEPVDEDKVPKRKVRPSVGPRRRLPRRRT